jgi:hypothetical protein
MEAGMIMGEKINLSQFKPKLSATDRRSKINSKVSGDNLEDYDTVSSSISSESDSDSSNTGQSDQEAVKILIPSAPTSRKDSGLPSSRTSFSSTTSLAQENTRIHTNHANGNQTVDTPNLMDHLPILGLTTQNTEQSEGLLKRFIDENHRPKEIIESISPNEVIPTQKSSSSSTR